MLQMAVALVVVAQAIMVGDLGLGTHTPIHPSIPANYMDSTNVPACSLLQYCTSVDVCCACSDLCGLEWH